MKIDWLYVFLIIVILIAVASLMTFRKDTSKCVASPLQYGIKEIEKNINSTVVCTCSILSGKYKPFFVTNNKTEIMP